jgi:hypothetical protein
VYGDISGCNELASISVGRVEEKGGREKGAFRGMQQKGKD